MVKAGAKMLAAQYTPAKRRMEKVSLAVFGALTSYVIYLVSRKMEWDSGMGVAMFICAALGMVSADFLSGLLHWAADTWGTVETPLFGKAFIRSFREHHIAPSAICSHDFIEANGDSAFMVNFLLLFNIHVASTASTRADLLTAVFLLFLNVFAMLSNEIHKWSHTRRPSAPIAMLQRLHVVLPILHHRTHHISPHETYYCITTGWLNAPFEAIRFWSLLESFISSVSGVAPRLDDYKWAHLNSK